MMRKAARSALFFSVFMVLIGKIAHADNAGVNFEFWRAEGSVNDLVGADPVPPFSSQSAQKSRLVEFVTRGEGIVYAAPDTENEAVLCELLPERQAFSHIINAYIASVSDVGVFWRMRVILENSKAAIFFLMPNDIAFFFQPFSEIRIVFTIDKTPNIKENIGCWTVPDIRHIYFNTRVQKIFIEIKGHSVINVGFYPCSLCRNYAFFGNFGGSGCGFSRVLSGQDRIFHVVSLVAGDEREPFGGAPEHYSREDKEKRENRYRVEKLIRIGWFFTDIVAAIIAYYTYPIISRWLRFKNNNRSNYHNRGDTDNQK